MIYLTIAQEKDIDAIEELLKIYMSESAYKNMTYSSENTRDCIKGWLESDFFFLAWEGKKLVGLAVMGLMRTFYEENEADVDMFYIHPDYRGKGVSRMLVENIVKNAEANKCGVVYTACLSGISDKNNKLYKNLWGKFGFGELGTVLIKN